MNHSAPKILYTASSSAHLVSFHLPYLAALRSLGWDVTAAANGSGEGLGEGVRFLAVPFTKSFVSPRNFRAAALLARDIRKNRYDVIVTHTSLAAFFTRLGVMLAGKKHTRVVNTVHGYLFDGGKADGGRYGRHSCYEPLRRADCQKAPALPRKRIFYSRHGR